MSSASSFKQPTGNFVTAVKPVFRRLLLMQTEFRQLDVSTLDIETVQQKLDALEAQEKRVMLAWARSTRDMSPGFLADVENNRCRYTNAVESYLKRMFVAN